MAKSKIVYSCIECGYKTAKWVGKCPQCGSWSSLEEEEELPREIKKNNWFKFPCQL